jgi:ribonuclease III-like protein
MLDDQNLPGLLTDKGLAQFGDALLNFAFSLALTETTGHPRGTKVSDRTLAEAAVKAGLRKYLPRRIGRGDVANSLEALLGYVWLKKLLTLNEILVCLKTESFTQTQNFAQLAELALARLKK